MDIMLKNLKKFGLAEKEAKIYIANLELGNSLAGEIALKSNLPRTLVYDILERLIDLGLASYAIKNNKKYFHASNPEELSRILKKKQQKSDGVKRPKVEIYEGKEGMKTVMDDILKYNIKEFLAYGSSRSSYEIIPAFIEDWHKQRIKKKILMRILYNNTKESKEKVSKFKKSLKLTRYRFMPISLESPTATLIYSDKVEILLYYI